MFWMLLGLNLRFFFKAEALPLFVFFFFFRQFFLVWTGRKTASACYVPRKAKKRRAPAGGSISWACARQTSSMPKRQRVKRKQKYTSCKIEDFVETHIFKLCDTSIARATCERTATRLDGTSCRGTFRKRFTKMRRISSCCCCCY